MEANESMILNLEREIQDFEFERVPTVMIAPSSAVDGAYNSLTQTPSSTTKKIDVNMK